VRGNEKLARSLKDPELAQRVQVIREQMSAVDAAYGASLAAVRKAGELTLTKMEQK